RQRGTFKQIKHGINPQFVSKETNEGEQQSGGTTKGKRAATDDALRIIVVSVVAGFGLFAGRRITVAGAALAWRGFPLLDLSSGGRAPTSHLTPPAKLLGEGHR